MGIEAPFSIETLEDRLLNRLDKKQETVQELSRWLIKHHENADVIVHTWVSKIFKIIINIFLNKVKMPTPSE